MSRILIADDDKSVRDPLVDAAMAAGHSVLVAWNVPVAKRLAEAGGIDVAILDVNMPGGSGLEVASHVRSRSLARAIIVMSGEDVEREAYAAGANAFLLKPFAPARVLEIAEGL